ncbi:hypothetical protein [uncultured Chryseobacterium sp.]|nr:hypothetical protein [uncultured Chryseobacterium sp.]
MSGVKPYLDYAPILSYPTSTGCPEAWTTFVPYNKRYENSLS